MKTGRPWMSVAIHLEVKGDLCAVDPEDFLIDLVGGTIKDAIFVAVREGSAVSASSRDTPAGRAASTTALPLSTPPKTGARSGSAASDAVDLSVPGVRILNGSSAAPADRNVNGGKSKTTARTGTSHNTPNGSRKDSRGGSVGSPPAGRYPSRHRLPRSATPLEAGPAPGAGHQRTQGPANKKARATRQSRLLPRASLQSRWQATETLILSAAMLHGTSSDQRESYAFLGELAGGAEAGRRLGGQLKTVAEADDDGIVVNRSGIVAICKTDRTPHGHECLSRYLFGDAYPEGNRPGETISAQRVCACFAELVRCIPDGPVDPLEKVWVGNERAARFKWTGQRAQL